MCEDCGCGEDAAKDPALERQHAHPHRHGDQEHAHPHEHAHEHGPHDHAHEHGHEHASEPPHQVLNVRQAILAKNDRLAERNRGYFKAKRVAAINVLSSPGSGKTALIERTLADRQAQLPMAVIVGDLATDNDAQRLSGKGAPVLQINTGTTCHLDAAMVGHAAEQLDLEGKRLLVIENVGNLVCPASYDLGEDARVVLLSVTEGEDKPLKYPVIFKSASVVVITKTDLAEATGFDRAKALANLKGIAPQARVLELSARSGAGLADWYDYLAGLAERR